MPIDVFRNRVVQILVAAFAFAVVGAAPAGAARASAPRYSKQCQGYQRNYERDELFATIDEQRAGEAEREGNTKLARHYENEAKAKIKQAEKNRQKFEEHCP